jgi:uncharacterized protein (PEP-CTERM system associated)
VPSARATAGWRVRAAVVAVLAACSHGLHAQPVVFEPSLAALVTWTDNAGLKAAPVAVEDVTTELSPSVAILAIRNRFRLIGDVGATAVNYLNETQRDRVLPRIRLNGNLEAIERFLFVDASIATAELVEDPFAGRAEGATTVNSYTATTYAVSPYVDWRLSPRTRLQLRSDNSRSETRGSDRPLRDGTFKRELVRFDVLPQPLGLTIEGERNDSRFSGLTQDTLLQTIGRVIVSYAPSPDWVLNVRGGYEENEFSGIAIEPETIYGGGLEWRPTERTVIRGVGEHRFFGVGWEGVFTHRMPWLAWEVRAGRSLSTFPQELLTLTSGGNVAALLDAMLTTRYPDAIERGRIVQDLIRREGLPTSIGGPLTIYTQQAFISTGRSITIGFLGVTNTLSFTAGYLRTEGAFPEVILVTPTGVGNSEQIASALTYGRRVTPFTAFSVTAGRTYIRGLGDAAVEETTQRAIRVALTHQLSPRAEVIAGVRRRVSDSAVSEDYTENSAFIGVAKRF